MSIVLLRGLNMQVPVPSAEKELVMTRTYQEMEVFIPENS